MQGTNGKIKSGGDDMGESSPWKQKATTFVGIVFVGGTFAQRTYEKQSDSSKCFSSYCKHFVHTLALLYLPRNEIN